MNELPTVGSTWVTSRTDVRFAQRNDPFIYTVTGIERDQIFYSGANSTSGKYLGTVYTSVWHLHFVPYVDMSLDGWLGVL